MFIREGCHFPMADCPVVCGKVLLLSGNVGAPGKVSPYFPQFSSFSQAGTLSAVQLFGRPAGVMWPYSFPTFNRLEACVYGIF